MKTNRGLNRFAIVVAISTILLIFAGGLVTSTGSGLSVPDWPLSFGKLFPEMKGGVAYEHGHRMLAALVGLLTIALAIWLGQQEPRKSVRLLGYLAVVAVLCQAALGGATVLFRLPVLLSVGHAALAELFLCLTVAIALTTSERWQEEQPRLENSGSPSIRTLAVLSTALVYVQILLGALMRHTGGGLSIPDFPLSYGRLVPPFFTGPILFNYAHRVVGLLVILIVIWFAVRVLGMSHSESSLRNSAMILILSLLLQIALGAATIWTHKAAIPTTLHVAGGAFTLAACLWLTIIVFRILSPRPEARRIQVAAA